MTIDQLADHHRRLREARAPRHVIADVAFAAGSEVGAVACACGWGGDTTGWDAHRRGRPDGDACARGHVDWEPTRAGRRCRACHRASAHRAREGR